MRKIDDDLLLKLKSEGLEQKEIARRFNVSPAAVSKRLKRLEELKPPESLKKLTNKQQKFCLSVAEGKTQTQSALDSFECNSMDSAKSVGSSLMRDPHINTAISDLMASEGITRQYRIQKLKNCIDHRDPNVVLKGLDQTWKLEKLYTEGPIVTVNIQALHAEAKDLDEEDRRLQKEIDKLEGKTVKDEVIDVKPDFAPV